MFCGADWRTITGVSKEHIPLSFRCRPFKKRVWNCLALKMPRTFETSVTIYQLTQHNIPEDFNRQERVVSLFWLSYVITCE